MDKIFRERYLIGLKGSREQMLADLFWFDPALTLIFFFPLTEKETCFEEGWIDRAMKSTNHRRFFFPIFKGETTYSIWKAGKRPHGCWWTAGVVCSHHAQASPKVCPAVCPTSQRSHWCFACWIKNIDFTHPNPHIYLFFLYKHCNSNKDLFEWYWS